MKIKTTKDRRTRIALRQRKRITGTPERPRLRVFRSVSHIYAQVIDDMSGTTVASAASTEPALKARSTARRAAATSPARRRSGKTIAERLIAKGIKRVVFDRGGFLYHGRIKADRGSGARGGAGVLGQVASLQFPASRQQLASGT